MHPVSELNVSLKTVKFAKNDAAPRGGVKCFAYNHKICENFDVRALH